MGKIGWSEFLIILIIAVIVIGPDKLPALGKSLGKAVSAVKKYVNETASEIADVEELKEIKKDVESIRTDVTSIGKNLEKSVTEAVNTPPKETAEKPEPAAQSAAEKPEPEPAAQAQPEPPAETGPEAAAAGAEENQETNEIHV